MSTLRPLIAPLTGTAVAGIVLYSMGSTLSIRTHQLSESLHFSSRSLRRLAEVDDTEDLVSKANIAPDATTMASEIDDWEVRQKGKLRAAFTQPSRPSLREEIKARWNDHLYSFTSSLSETDIDHVINATTSTLSNIYHRLTGTPITTSSGKPDKITEWAGRAYQTAHSTSSPSSGTSPATLRDPLPPQHDIRLDAPNTYYLGQGTSLR